MKNLILFPLLCLLIAACTQKTKEESSYTAYTGATILDGSGAAPIPDGVLLISNGKVVTVGARSGVKIPNGTVITNVSGKFIIPGLINTHGHVGDVKGIEGGYYSHKNVIDNLGLYARYGITTVVSLGGDQKESEDIRAVNDTMSLQHARLYTSGEVITGDTPAEALAIIDSNAHMGVDFMKIRVDDNLGTSKKMTEDVYRAVIKRSHELGYKIATHMYYLDDAKKLLDAGSDMMAHSVRDKPVDEEFIKSMKDKKACYCPTLTREFVNFVYGDTAAFFSDPFFKREFDSVTIQPLKDPARQEKVRNSNSAKVYRQQLPVAMANLKTLSDNGVPIVFGTDSGVPTRFMGYFEHLELKMMADAGLTPMQVIQSATKTAAVCMGLKNLGELKEGNFADFLILDADPLEDILNSRKISGVFIGGVEIRR
ncbi:MAG: amidohydrolase family protein [Bacteroidota bacterium]